jgi:hypothetical protein
MTDEERDAHLRAALRHAPDAQLQPPPALSALILKEAQAKARDASPAPARAPRHPWLSVWDWLARPAVATGFAGMMVATLVGLMWWDQPMDEAMPRPPAPAASPAPAPVPAATQASAAPATEVARTAPQPPPAPQRKSAPVAKPAAAAAPAPEAAAREETAAPIVREARETAPPVALSAPPPAPTPAAAADTATGGAPAMERAKSFDESKRQRSVASARGEISPATLGQETEARFKLAQLRAVIAADPARWSWQRDGTTRQGINDAMLGWLARLDAIAGDRWQPADANLLRAGRDIRLLRDGQMQHTLRLMESGVAWQLPQGRWQLVTLPPASMGVLETSAP